MPNTLPEKFKVKTSQQKFRSNFKLHHNHLTTTDFFKIQPVLCRKVEPNDEMRIDCTSFVRLFPMPFPVFGRIRYYNRCFFVPYRQIMEGFNEFITDTQYNTSSGFVKIQSAPWFTDKDLCDAFMASTHDYPADSLIDVIPAALYWKDSGNYDILTDNTGTIVYWKVTGTGVVGNRYIFFRRRKEDGSVIAYVQGSIVSGGNTQPNGTYTYDSTSETAKFTIHTTWDSDDFTFEFIKEGGQDLFFGPYIGSFEGDIPLSSTPYDDIRYDFRWHNGSSYTYYRFTNKGRHFYNVLTSLKYRVSFSNIDGAFTNTSKRSAGKLLAYLKVYLDWYSPSAYAENHELRMLFRGVNSAGRHITYQELMKIAYSLDYATYERDYFTGAWQNPTGPNVDLSDVQIDDITVDNSKTNRSFVRTTSTNDLGSDNGTPVIGSHFFTNGSISYTDGRAVNMSYYMIEQLRALTNVTRRAQLTGNRAVDRYLAQYGIKLTDDQVNRCYYIGGYHYDADIMDIMSTADTQQAALGDYAGKGIAYSDAHRDFRFESGQEHGFIIVVSSVVPSVGYVQGIDRENLQLTRYEFFNGDFDNLGTQAQQNQELFADAGMPGPDGEEHAYVLHPEGVRGFVPRYIEEKIGFDNLTGDFNIPSRREGMDAFHLFRLFNDPNLPSVNKGFLIGEQKQYDRIFNNINDDYDHMYVEHHVLIDAYRNMKSVNEIYDFEHSDGKEIDVNANGTQLN